VSTLCPNGHDSEAPDWCSVCGERIAGSTAPEAPAAAAPTPAASTVAPLVTPPAPSGPSCENCGVTRHEHDVFCESCGYDFASGSLPEAPDTEETAAAPAPVHARVHVDPDFFAASVGDDVELDLPSPLPAEQVVPLNATRIQIGRTSTSRSVFPQLDVRALTNDPAVSTQHALLERDGDGQWTLTDLGSTNGTFLTSAADEPIDPGTAYPLPIGSSVFVGAWTRIDLAETSV